MISRDADADLDGILDYSIAAHGRAVAEAYLRTIHARSIGYLTSRISVLPGAIYRPSCGACPAVDIISSISWRPSAC